MLTAETLLLFPHFVILGDSATSTAVGGRSPYGNMFSPIQFGSGGNLAPGGGAIHLQVYGTMQMSGSIRADGGNACGAGAGGSLWIEAGVLNGDGNITANGGSSLGATCGMLYIRSRW